MAENKSENSKSIDLLDMTANITITGLDENIEKLERLKKLMQEVGELSHISNTSKPNVTDDELIRQALIDQLKDIRKVSAYEDHEGLPQLTEALCEVVDRLRNP